MLAVGDQVPQLPVTDDRGNTINTADWRGKTTVLWFYPKDDTPG